MGLGFYHDPNVGGNSPWPRFIPIFNEISSLKKKTNPTQSCASIIPYFNTKLFKTPNNLITLEYP
jgi:hypothetical protein